ncbi:DNA-directed RNA polymerase subunit beta' [Dirofilaria immitis]
MLSKVLQQSYFQVLYEGLLKGFIEIIEKHHCMIYLYIVRRSLRHWCENLMPFVLKYCWKSHSDWIRILQRFYLTV